MSEETVLANYRCLKCGHKFSNSPGPISCPACNHKYVRWLNYKDFKVTLLPIDKHLKFERVLPFDVTLEDIRGKND